MQSARIDMFFSCSARKEDKAVNDFFHSICEALDIKCDNVNNGAFSEVPPDVAKKMIDESQALIAIATKRDELTDGTFRMPPGVAEELAIAFGKNYPTLLFVEEGVSIDGMKGNFGTHYTFNRKKLFKPDSIEVIIKSIHCLKMEILQPNDLIIDHENHGLIAEHIHQLIELKK